MITLFTKKLFDNPFNIFSKNGQIYAQWGFIPSEDMADYGTYNEASFVPSGNYDDDVTKAIRLRYSLNEELALSRQRDIKTAEWVEYFEFCEMCKQVLKYGRD